jgi:cytochrome c-type biogenesis protein CcmH/NrfG
MTDPRLTQLGERRDQILADLRDLDAQIAAGEIAADHAKRLQTRYEAAAADTLSQIEGFTPSPRPARSSRRVLAGVGISVAIVALVAFTLVRAIEPRPEGGYVTGGVAAEVASDVAVDLSTITTDEMEEVVAANPDIFAMRLALARRYVEAGDFGSALPHYMYVLERETNAEALTYVGWMTYASGDVDTGVTLLERSLEVLPGDALTQWFLANALYFGTGDTAAALPLLQAVLDTGDAPSEIVAEAERMMAEASS